MEYEVSDIGFRTVTDKEQDGDVKISIKATVKNDADDDEVGVTIQGVDKDGFELASIFLAGHVPIGRSRVLTTACYVENSLLQQIVDWQQG